MSVRRVSTVHQSLVVCRGKAVPSSLSQVLVLPPWGSNPGGFHSADQCSTNLTNITVWGNHLMVKGINLWKEKTNKQTKIKSK